MKEKYSTLLVVFIMALISFVCLTFGVSYSYVIGTRTGNNTQNITTGNINATVSYNYAELAVEPMTDVEGLAQTTYGKISVNKNNSYSIYYNINLSYELMNLPAGKTTANFLPAEFIKIAIYDVNGGNLSSSPLMGPVRMGDLPIHETNSADIFQTTYTLLFNKFPVGTASKEYAMKVWIDEDVDDIYDETVAYLRMGIYQEPLVSKSVYNLKGKVYNGSSTVANATIKLQNGAVTTTTDSSGSFTINDVPVGTYNLLVNNKETTIHVQSGSANSVTKTAATTGTSGTYLQNKAFQYYTTPYKIIKNSGNSISTDSNHATTVSYNIPSAYVITGTEAIGSVDINNIKIDLAASNMISLGS